jgi:hypothetical protein
MGLMVSFPPDIISSKPTTKLAISFIDPDN